jgi:hypothetical protein
MYLPDFRLWIIAQMERKGADVLTTLPRAKYDKRVVMNFIDTIKQCQVGEASSFRNLLALIANMARNTDDLKFVFDNDVLHRNVFSLFNDLDGSEVFASQ